MTKKWKELAANIASCFSKEEINNIGKTSRFVQRSTSRLDGMSFLLMNVFDSSSGKERSLNDSCDWLEEHFNINMSKQSLDERYNTFAVKFMKSCFQRTLDHLNEKTLQMVHENSFSCIQLTDSTSFKLPEQLKVFYKGYKGNGGLAMIKLHLNYDLLKGSIADINIGDGSENDNVYNFGAAEKIQKDGLYIRDLGYYGFEYFKKIAEEKAYFLSRGKSNATFYNKIGTRYEKIETKDLLPLAGSSKEYAEVYLGGYKKKLKVRLIIESVPEEVSAYRLSKLKEYAAKQKDKSVSEQRKAMCCYNFFITNIPAEKLSIDKIRLTYSLRWQIELMFKTWKSFYNIDKLHQMNIFRFECYLYAKLIAILLDKNIQNSVSSVMMETFEDELSTIKASKFIKKTLGADGSDS